MDPRWKDFSYLQRLSYQKHVESFILLDKLQAFETKQLAYSFLKEEFNNLSGLSRNSTAEYLSNDSNNSKQKEFDLFDILVINNCLTSSNDDNSELFMYQNEREINRNGNPLEWWCSNRKKYPILSQLAFKYLCITATSSPSERMFSATGQLTSDRRSRLTPDNVDILLFLQKNS